MKKITIKQTLILIFAAILLVFSLWYNTISLHRKIMILKEQNTEQSIVITKLEEVIKGIKTEQIVLFKDSVYNYILEIKLEHPNIVFKQALLESGYFTSTIFKENSNMFGMKKAYQRPNLQEKEINRGHAVYKDWKRCIDDYAIFQARYYSGLDSLEYMAKLKRSYAVDTSYINILKKM